MGITPDCCRIRGGSPSGTILSNLPIGRKTKVHIFVLTAFPSYSEILFKKQSWIFIILDKVDCSPWCIIYSHGKLNPLINKSYKTYISFRNRSGCSYCIRSLTEIESTFQGLNMIWIDEIKNTDISSRMLRVHSIQLISTDIKYLGGLKPQENTDLSISFCLSILQVQSDSWKPFLCQFFHTNPT